MHRRWTVTVPPEDEQGCREHQVAGEQGEHEPPRHDVAEGQADEHRDDVEPVDGWIQQPSDRALLPVSACDHTVEVVRGAADAEKDHCPAIGLRAENQIKEERDTEEPEDTERVGDGPDLGRRHAATLPTAALHPFSHEGHLLPNLRGEGAPLALRVRAADPSINGSLCKSVTLGRQATGTYGELI